MDAVVDAAVPGEVAVGELRQQGERDAGLEHLVGVAAQLRHEVAEPAGQTRAVARRVVGRLPQLVQLSHQPAAAATVKPRNARQATKVCRKL